ncbi:MAG: hypothetical protein L0219_21500, partial [Phycisphaerales bacterium]|nr:hypothetical protein [Phycisphaerales bacterium]
LSRKFVNVKLDLETEAGAKLADELELVGSPAFAIYHPNGEVALRQTGYAEAEVMSYLLRSGLEIALRSRPNEARRETK